MKKIIIRHTSVLSVLIVLGGLFSCQTELLDPVPKTLFSDKVVFDTPERIALQVNTLYDFIKSGQLLGGRYQVYGDIRANDFINTTSNGVTGYLVWNHTLTETSQNDVNNVWVAAYAAINQANVFLEGLDANTGKFVAPTFPDDYATTTVNQYRGEARFVRALAYYCLLQLYARPYVDGNGSRPGLPLRLLAEKSSEHNDLARSSVGEVYAQIISDLNFAEQNLPLSYGTATLNVTRAHRNSAIALKTRVYLSMGPDGYPNVIIEANKIVPATGPFMASSGVQHRLEANIANVFASPQETLETILAFPFSAQDAPGTQNQLGYYFQPTTQGGNGEYSLNPAGIIADMTAWPASDARRGLTTVAGGSSYVMKYTGDSPYLDKAPVIRYAEVLLNLSEALARTTAGVDARALALLNAVRQRSDNSVTLSPATNGALIDLIMAERRIEFLGEGIRNIDIMRLNAPIPGKGAVPAINPSDDEYVWPIPASELAANSLMTRNN